MLWDSGRPAVRSLGPGAEVDINFLDQSWNDWPDINKISFHQNLDSIEAKPRKAADMWSNRANKLSMILCPPWCQVWGPGGDTRTGQSHRLWETAASRYVVHDEPAETSLLHSRGRLGLLSLQADGEMFD